MNVSVLELESHPNKDLLKLSKLIQIAGSKVLYFQLPSIQALSYQIVLND